ncbi:hypothetical protein P153DRAFT_290113 [Dothidotthia symphoricarpi CBS 119687]|uniref:Uncharacterized protein n=1 Tax=Dothidotthia symphoricarpi CBS 119687 TaxID=1392245 RepID=A0A6A6AGS6_9PLEO|nr:uncharacterized protein P153DRAFT_290113 [Dothidotthia symphoricarpi CBS 119687]KAF2130124.1 hypothetical protein P153DRAFT_290113 [Dothidotthia symphoricarpi CBS 119687]
MLGRCTPHLQSCLSLAERALRARCRLYSTNTYNLKGDQLGPTREDAHGSFRARRDGTLKELPLPPLLDPVVLEKRSRWEQTKQQPDVANFTPFQKKLWENPFAHALASPVRQCRATQVSLPESLFVSLYPRPHPTTNDPWLLPVSLTAEGGQLGTPYYFLGREIIATSLGKKKAWERLMNSRMLHKLGSSVRKMVWREDMPSLILDLMRKRLVKKLSWNFGFKGRLTPVASEWTEDIKDVEDVSCVLVFRSLRLRADDLQDCADEIASELEKWSLYFMKGFTAKLDPHASPEVTHASPTWYFEPLVPRLQPRLQFPELEFKSTTWRGTKVPLYSLTDLLGPDKAQELIKGSKYEKEKCVIIKRARHNVPVEMLFMQLQAYIAKPGP